MPDPGLVANREFQNTIVYVGQRRQLLMGLALLLLVVVNAALGLFVLNIYGSPIKSGAMIANSLVAMWLFSLPFVYFNLRNSRINVLGDVEERRKMRARNFGSWVYDVSKAVVGMNVVLLLIMGVFAADML